ncbi:MAG: hypothetical protein ACLP1Q_17140 [Solirubrobacteraceae bacterium]
MTRVPWTESEPAHLRAERGQVTALAPDLDWTHGLRHAGRDDLVGFQGTLPAWCAQRPEPPGVAELLAGERLTVRCVYAEATPMIPPVIFPVEPEVPITLRTDHSWHLNGDGSLCLLQAAGDWEPGETAVPLLVKASCWFVEYRLKERGLIDAMSENGVARDDCFDSILGSLVA